MTSSASASSSALIMRMSSTDEEQAIALLNQQAGSHRGQQVGNKVRTSHCLRVTAYVNHCLRLTRPSMKCEVHSVCVGFDTAASQV
jgi:hypothetical protein